MGGPQGLRGRGQGSDSLVGIIPFWGDEMFWNSTEVVFIQYCTQNATELFTLKCLIL